MKKTAFALAATIFIVVVACPTVRFANANPIPYSDTPSTELPTLVIRTPEVYSDYYADNTFKLDFTIIKPESWTIYYRGMLPLVGEVMFYVYLDGNRSLPRLLSNFTVADFSVVYISDTVIDYTFIFRNLTDSEHIVQIVVEAKAIYMGYYERNGETIGTGISNNTYITQTAHFQLYPDSKTVSFQKDPQVVSKDPYPNPPTPVPIIISPQNTSYTTDDIAQFTLPFDFSINATASWIGYSLDNQSRITINGNGTLSELSVGLHNITLFASGTFGNTGISKTTYFIIEPEPFPTSLLMASSVIVVVVLVGLGLLLCKIKRK
jgi:hypothetical protein